MMYSKSAGTLEYSAPERIKDQHGFTNKIDMWAAGLVLFILLVGSHPFECQGSTARLFSDILNGETIVK